MAIVSAVAVFLYLLKMSVVQDLYVIGSHGTNMSRSCWKKVKMLLQDSTDGPMIFQQPLFHHHTTCMNR